MRTTIPFARDLMLMALLLSYGPLGGSSLPMVWMILVVRGEAMLFATHMACISSFATKFCTNGDRRDAAPEN